MPGFVPRTTETVVDGEEDSQIGKQKFESRNQNLGGTEIFPPRRP